MSEQRPLPELIAWTSVATLTAGMSQIAVPAANFVWIVAGLLGLISSVGLEQARRRRERLEAE